MTPPRPLYVRSFMGLAQLFWSTFSVPRHLASGLLVSSNATTRQPLLFPRKILTRCDELDLFV